MASSNQIAPLAPILKSSSKYNDGRKQVNISSSTSTTALSVTKQGIDDSYALQQQQQQQLRMTTQAHRRQHQQQHASINSTTNNRSKSNLYFANFNNNVNKDE